MTYQDSVQEVRCPKCHGHTWDNRTTKRNPKAPDYKCKDKQCDGAVWLDSKKPGMPQPSSPPVATSGKAPYSAGGPLPFEQSETGAPPSAAVDVPTLDRLFHLYDVCFEHAYSVAHKKMGNDCTHEGIAAQAATLFIAAKGGR
jgi:hypothetical protein